MFQAFPQSSEANTSNNETATRLLVIGQVSLEDIWTIFRLYGEVSSIVLVEGGTKVTFLNDEVLDRFHQSGEIIVGRQRLVVTKIRERRDREGLGISVSLPPPPPIHAGRRFTVPPPPLNFSDIPPPPLPLFSTRNQQ